MEVREAPRIGVILAAGFGSRLRPYTNELPKCLARVNGQPIIDYQLDAFREANIHDLVVVTGYESKKLERHLVAHNDINFRLIENSGYETSGNMVSLYQTRAEVAGQSFVLTNGDVVMDENLIKVLLESGFENCIGVSFGCHNPESMKVGARSDASLNSISKALSPSESVGISADTYVFSAGAALALFEEMRSLIDEEGQSSLWTEIGIDRVLAKHRFPFFGVDLKNVRWFEIDTEEDLVDAEILFGDATKIAREAELLTVDLDGTLLSEGSPIDGAGDFLQKVVASGREICVLSNNSSRSIRSLTQEIINVFPMLSPHQVRLSTHALLEFLAQEGITSVSLIGTHDLRGALEGMGVTVDGTNAELVIVSFDRELTYEKLEKACRLIHAGVPYVATHLDDFYPTPNGGIPDAGAIVSLLEKTTGKPPSKALGKPNPAVLPPVWSSGTVDPGSSVIIGDRLDTDGLLAAQIGAKFILVLSGATSRLDLESSDVPVHAIIRSVADLLSD